ncbi:MAG: HAMP domain-containing histidine kinase [Firmicutes bacterium]|nr:HAMP domain-containing histidine kinase [Bacillota bacterium]
MKFWQKIFIYSLILFLITFNLGGFFLIENSHNFSLKREMDRGLSEHYSIYTAITYYTLVSNSLLKNNSIDSNNEVITDYLKTFDNENAYLEVLDKNNSVVFSNIDLEIPKERVEIKKASRDRRRYIIRDIEDKTFLFITNLLDINGNTYKLTYIRDITYVYKDRLNQYNFFIKIETIISMILAIGMYILSKYITNPIDKLINSTKMIARGNYTERVNIHSKDEVGVLAENFNHMASAIDEKINELKTKTEEKQRFIDNLSHEMKTPLTSIIGYADFLRSTPYNEKTFIEGLNYIHKEGKRLEGLSWRMMNLILLKKENFSFKKENIKILLLDIKDYLKPKLQKKKIDLVISAKEYEVFVEEDLIKILVSNLIDNSIKASNKGSNIYINVYKSSKNKVILEIKDEGIGIPKEDIPKVFEAFYMVDKSRTRANNGAGLGLSICGEIAKLHKAKIEIESELNKGTNIKVIFP